MMIRIATAECFTHGRVGAEIHSFSRGYPCTYPWSLNPSEFQLSLVAGLFIPTLSAVQSVLKITPIPPVATLDDIKVYDQELDLSMAVKMAESVRTLTESDIGIGTTAGIGRGGIAIVCDTEHIVETSDVYADLKNSSPDLIFDRQRSGLFKAIDKLEHLLKIKYS